MYVYNIYSTRVAELESSLESSHSSITAMEADKNILLAKTTAYKDDVDSKNKVIHELQEKVTEQVTSNKDITIALHEATATKENLTQLLDKTTTNVETLQKDLISTRGILEEVSCLQYHNLSALCVERIY